MRLRSNFIFNRNCKTHYYLLLFDLICTLWYRLAMSALMAHTSAAMSSTKRSGKRWRLGRSSFEVRNKWLAMLFVWRREEKNTVTQWKFDLPCYNYDDPTTYWLTMSWKKNQACCSAASLTVLVLTTHCNASSSWRSWAQTNTHTHTVFQLAQGNDYQRWDELLRLKLCAFACCKEHVVNTNCC